MTEAQCSEWSRSLYVVFATALTLVLMLMFLGFLVGQMITGFYEFNAEQEKHGRVAVTRAPFGQAGAHLRGAHRCFGS